MATYDTIRDVVAGPSIANRFFTAFTGMTGGTANVRPSIANRLFSAVTGAAGAFADWNDSRVTRNALSKLSDHELDDLGLTRSDIADMKGRLSR